MVEQASREKAAPTVHAATVANRFAEHMDGTLERNKIDAAMESLEAATAHYGATGSVASMIFYLQFTVQIKEGKQFKGHAGGVSTPGGGALFGDVYTDDLDRLYRDTHSFEFQSTPVYLSILFFDQHSNLLGHFQSGAVSIVSGVGGGTGSWE